MYPLKLKPIYDKTIWANDVLTKARGIKEKGFGTCWEISAHPHAQNVILNKEYAGITLGELIDLKPTEMLGKHPKEAMLRLAYLDAKEDLSIQVHPDEAYAKAHENDQGKCESWYILEAKKGATLVAGTLSDDKEAIKKAIHEETLETYLRKVPMEAGDFIYIDAGMLHALGGGILAIEVGTNSNTTYRFYDYGRKDASGNGRELHLDKGFDVVGLNKRSEKVATPMQEGIEQKKVLEDGDAFKVTLYDICGELNLDTKGYNFHCLSFVHNDAIVEYNEEEYEANYCENMFIPASCGKYKIKGNCRVLVSVAK
ncbi:MAG: type I phosphomannose isomerase catalytic subunit [Anaerorhabdus sp.]